ncbi:hypothetical protein ACF0H5_009982 [Mactra antiquata]
MASSSNDKSLLNILAEKVVRSGELYIPKKAHLSRKHWERSYGILTDQFLTICHDKNSKDARKSYAISTFEAPLTEDNVNDEQYCFVITFEKRHKTPLLFACDRDDTRETWIDHIKEVITKCKKFSDDSAYASGGSMSGHHGDYLLTKDMYNVIDELKVKTFKEHEDESRDEATNVKTIPNEYVDVRGELLSSSATSKSDNQSESGFLEIRQKSKVHETRPKGIYIDHSIDHKMDTLKAPIPESVRDESGFCIVDDGQNIYENEQYVADVTGFDVNKLRKEKKTKQSGDKNLSNHEVPLAVNPTEKAKQDVKPSDSPRQLEKQEAVVAWDDSVGEFALYGNGGAIYRSAYSARSSNSSESTFYENVNFADDSTSFKEEEYVTKIKINKSELKSKPIGTFLVRPGRDTKQELAVHGTEGYISLFRIHEKDGRLYIREDQIFSTLNELINFYRVTTLPTDKYKVTLMQGHFSKPI